MAKGAQAPQDVLERIKKMLALADVQRNDNEHEAERAMEMAHALLEKHGLDLAQVQIETGGGLDIEDWKDDYRSQYDTWNKHLSYACARLFNCRSYISHGQWVYTNSGEYRKMAMGFIGERTDVAMVREVWPWLVKHVRWAARCYAGKGWNASHRSFAEAFAMRVYVRADNIAKADLAKTQAERTVIRPDGSAAPLCTALVVAEKKHAIDKWLEDQGIKFGKGRKSGGPRGDYDPYAAHAGDDAGRNVNLNFKRQVNGEATKAIE